MLRRLLMTSMLATALAAPAMAADMSRADIENIIHDYIMKNPQVLIDSVNKMEMDKQAQTDVETKAKIKENYDWLYKNKDHAQAGNPKGDVTVIEFFDYNCGYCKQAVNDVMTLLEEDKNLRLVFIEIPILGDSSLEAAQWALAANKQDQYLPFHLALMRHKGPFSTSVFEDYAKKAGLDVEKLKKDKDSEAIVKILEENLNKSRDLGITGTPGFIIGDNVIRGYVGIDGMRAAITDTRKKK